MALHKIKKNNRLSTTLGCCLPAIRLGLLRVVGHKLNQKKKSCLINLIQSKDVGNANKDLMSLHDLTSQISDNIALLFDKLLAMGITKE